MARRARSILGGYVYHVLNRANGRLRLFKKDADFAAFERVLHEAHERVPLRILGYVLMGNHWHFVVWPKRGQHGEVSEFFRWLTVTHSQRWHAHHGTAGMGHVYQGRFKSFPIAADEHLVRVLRYVERNPLRARLVKLAEAWRWGSLYRRTQGTAEEKSLLADSPVPLGRLWTEHVNRPQTEAELAAIRQSLMRGRPYGGELWQAKVMRQLGLEHTLRPRGRPRTSPLANGNADANQPATRK
jgi:putative transposase